MNASGSNRQPAGTPTGGQFTATSRPETDLTLEDTLPWFVPSHDLDTGVLYEPIPAVPFDASDPDHVGQVELVIADCWSADITRPDRVLALIDITLTSRGITADHVMLAAHPTIGRMLANRWPEPGLLNREQRAWARAGVSPAAADRWAEQGLHTPAQAAAFARAEHHSQHTAV